MKLLIFILASVELFAQFQNPITVLPGAGSATGSIRLRERRNQAGDNWAGIQAPQSLPVDLENTLPSAHPLTLGQCLTSDLAGFWSWGPCGGHVIASEYNWIQTITAPGAAGTHTITLTPGPRGVAATDTVSYYWMIGTAGAPERVKSTGTGTCDGTGQASCTVQVITANSHTGTTTVQSGTVGAQEATNYNAGNSITLYYPKTAATILWYTEYNTVGKNVSFRGDGFSIPSGGSAIALATSAARMIVRDTAGSIQVSGMTMGGNGSSTAIYVGPQLQGGQDIIAGNWLASHGTAIEHRSVSNTQVFGNVLYCWDVCVKWGNEYWGDQGAGSFYDNVFVNLATGGTTKAMHLHAAAATYIHGNSFLGLRDNIYFDGRMAVVNTSGATVTATSDFTFSTLVTPGLTVYINGASYVVSTRDSSTQLTLTSSAGTQSGVDFGIYISQIRINDNNFDNQERTSIHIAGAVASGDIQIDNNRFQRVTETEEYWAIKVTNPYATGIAITNNRFSDLAIGTTNPMTAIYATSIGRSFVAANNTMVQMKYGMTLDLAAPVSNNQTGVISGNMFDTNNFMSVARAMYLKNLSGFSISGNNLQNVNTGLVIDGSSSNNIQIKGTTAFCNGANPSTVVSILAGAAGINVDGVVATSSCGYGVLVNAAVTAGATTVRNVAISGGAYLANVSAGVSTLIEDSQGVTFAGLSANAKNGTFVYCSDCKPVASSVCASAGTGAYAARLNGIWNCAASNDGQWSVDGANIYYPSTGNVGIGLTPGSYRLAIGGGAAGNSMAISHGAAFSNAILSVDTTYSIFGTYSPTDFVFATDSTGRWRINSAGMLVPEGNDTKDIGLTGTRVRAVYGRFGDFAGAGTTGDYVSSRSIRVVDFTGGSGTYAFEAGGSMASNSYLKAKDNAGSRVFETTRAAAGVPLNYTGWYTAILPAKRLIANGDAVDDSVFPDFGSTGARWPLMYGDAIDLTGGATIGGNLSAAVINATGSPAYRVAGTTVIFADRSASFTALTATGGAVTLLPGAAAVVGECWIATSVGGAGDWDTCAAGGGAPFIDSTAIIKDNADATKLLRFEVGGFSTGVTRVATPPNSDFIMAATNINQTFTAANTFSSSSVFSGTINSDFVPGTNDAFLLGTASFRWASLAIMDINIGSGGFITGDLAPTTTNTGAVGLTGNYWNMIRTESIRAHGGNISPATTLVGELGSSSLVWNKTTTNNIRIDGTVTAPNGNSGVSATGAACVITAISGGIITGATC